jgi:uncharacterized protein YqgC (DUF456 family)
VPLILHITIIVLTFGFIAAGLVGSILPMLPGAPLIFAGALIYAFYTDFSAIGGGTLVLLSLLTGLSLFLDFFASLSGVKKAGASRWGMLGAFLGGLVGLFVGGIVGLIFGPIIGAVIFEMAGGGKWASSWRIALGHLLGLLLGTLGKFLLALLMIIIFLVRIMA